MKKVLLYSLVFAAAPLKAQSVDSTGSGALIAQAMDRSEIMKNLQYLSDAIGPRLSGSAAMRKANEWTAQRLRDYGLRVTMEEYPFGVAWQRGPASARLTAPFGRYVNAWSWAWTAGTGGKPLEGPIMRIDVTNADSLAQYRDRVRWKVAPTERAFGHLESGRTAYDRCGLGNAEGRGRPCSPAEGAARHVGSCRGSSSSVWN